MELSRKCGEKGTAFRYLGEEEAIKLRCGSQGGGGKSSGRDSQMALWLLPQAAAWGGVTFVFIWGNREGHRVKEEAH